MRMRIKLFQAALIWLPVFLAHSKKISIQEAYRNASTTDPKSCESVYYGLFTDGTNEKKTFEGDGTNTMMTPSPSLQGINLSQEKQRVLETEKKVQEIYVQNIFTSPMMKAFEPVTQEWNKRIEKTHLIFYGLPDDNERVRNITKEEEDDPNGAFMDLFNSSRIIPSEKDSQKSENPDSYEFKMVEPKNVVGENVDGNRIEKYEEGAGPPVLTWSVGLLANAQSQAAAAFRIGHELSHTMDWAPDNLIECLGRESSIGARRSSHKKLQVPATIPPPKAETRKWWQRLFSHMNFGSGKGTELIAPVGALIEQGSIDRAKELIAHSTLPPQMAEAVADYYGTRIVTKFIQKNYSGKNAKRNAALALLFSLPPQLFDKESAEIMNTAGSKKTNEERVFKLILANKEFRELIGCNLQQNPQPIECP
jgi:hypothetical protein